MFTLLLLSWTQINGNHFKEIGNKYIEQEKKKKYQTSILDSDIDGDIKLGWNINLLGQYIFDKKANLIFSHNIKNTVSKIQEVIALLSVDHVRLLLANYLQISPVNLVTFMVSWEALREKEQEC